MAEISARSLDALAGLSYGHVNAIESGTKKDFNVSTLSSIARVLGLSLDWLVSGLGKAPTTGSVRASVERAERRRKSAARAHA